MYSSSGAAFESCLWRAEWVGEGCRGANGYGGILAHWRTSNAEVRYRLRVLSVWVWHRDGASDGVSARVAKCYGMYVDSMRVILYVVGDVLGSMSVRSMVYWVVYAVGQGGSGSGWRVGSGPSGYRNPVDIPMRICETALTLAAKKSCTACERGADGLWLVVPTALVGAMVS